MSTPHIHHDCTVDERWRPVAGYEGFYEVSDKGNVRSLDRVNARGYRLRGREMKTPANSCGYPVVTLRKFPQKPKVALVHPLVAAAFLSPPAHGQTQVNHRDGCKTNNRASNLEWCTALENTRHAHLTGLASSKGENHGQAILSESQVRDVFRRAWEGERQQSIADQFGVSKSNVGEIKRAKTWRHITVPLLAAREAGA